MPGRTCAGRRAGHNGSKYHEHCSGAAPIGPQTQHAASLQHERSPFVKAPRRRMTGSCLSHQRIAVS
jgi:hypothetical protein